MIGNDWLEQYAPGFNALKGEERRAIANFLFLWSLFEANVLDLQGSIGAIEEVVERWERKGHLTKESFKPEVSYFRCRYFVGGKCTPHYNLLKLRDNDSPELVKEVMQNMNATPKEVTTVILIIVYRIRNNLFHGEKWSYGLQGQLNNFNHANEALRKAIELNGKVAKN